MAGSNTIAFNTKTMNWTTEYSFSPYRFSYVGNQLVSFPQGTSNIGHLHDKSFKYNQFYGETYPSEIQVVTNENPSATKIYEAFSLESTIGDWSADFRTETGEPQESSFVAGSLVEKEGKHYIDIPKNSSNTDLTIKYVGKTTIGKLKDAQSSQKIALEGRPLSVPNGYLLFALPAERPDNIFAPDWQSIFIQYKGTPYFYSYGEDGVSFLEGVDSFVPNVIDESISQTYDPVGNTISFVPALFEFDNAMADVYGISGDAYDDLVVSIYTTSLSAELNGEDMRGEYMKVKISRTGNEYYELYAINVDQHTTKLDHSLGQNN